MKDQRVFWLWFERNEQRFRNVEVDDKEQLLDEILEQLHAYCPNLWFEIGRADDGVCELIVTAEGDIDHFSAVRTLIAAAPPVPGWRFLAFKPAMGFEFDTSYAGITFSPEATWYLPLRSSSDPSALGLRVGYAHFDATRSQDFLTGTFIMLECALGELALAEKVQHIEVAALPSSPETSGYSPLPQLADLVHGEGA
ncbi:hypothetical protein QFW80_08895 [Luteimonas sp. M1R5S18]|uniref:Cell division protein ZapC n=1 Tax=Luteimonas rhizosphaericola TaxID=3042024 RepID=A0ABT6JIY0_9GAMM|nr:hypothetical protein [Luteimonas rhizosphaericola]MDH5830629.1 hypothetical protein [Luteimonas rhizosphaericola]